MDLKIDHKDKPPLQKIANLYGIYGSIILELTLDALRYPQKNNQNYRIYTQKGKY